MCGIWAKDVSHVCVVLSLDAPVVLEQSKLVERDESDGRAHNTKSIVLGIAGDRKMHNYGK